MRRYVYSFIAVAALCGTSGGAAPTFADLAVVTAKEIFQGHLPADASIEQCAALLNRHGVFFSLFDLMDPFAEVSREDMARALGQSTLLFLGEAELNAGGIQLPDEASDWVDYCLLNDVRLDPIWKRFLQKTSKKSFSEVEDFYGRAK